MSVQMTYPLTLTRAFAGLLADSGPNDIVSGLVRSRRAVTTITVPASPDDSVDYSLSVNGIVVAYSADASSTTAEVRDGLLAALVASPFIVAIATCAAVSTDQISITAKQTDFTLTVTSPSNATTTADLTITVTTAAGVNIPFGRFVKHGGASNGNLIADPLGATSDIILGVSVHSHSHGVAPYTPRSTEDTSGGADTAGILAGEIGSFIRKGRIWVLAEEALAITDTLYARCIATAANTTLGALRNDSDSSNALAIPTTCKLLEYDSSTGLALMDITL